MTRIRRLALATASSLIAGSVVWAQNAPLPDPQTDAGTGATAGQPLQVGQVIDPALLHRVSRPGLYGIGRPVAGSDFGVLAGRLIRYDADTMRVQAVIRQIDDILD